MRLKVTGIYVVLLVANLLAWFWALAFLAYGFGLRHAVDADHIAAIDNVTRKLMQEGKCPASVGLFFSLGHSTVVVLASAAVALAASALEGRFSEFKEIGGMIGTTVSALFLFVIAIINLFVFAAVFRNFRTVRRGGTYVEEDLNVFLANRGLLGRLFRPLFRMIAKSWHMYPLGFLFGLGFDTATEIGLLGVSAAEASKGLSIWSIMVFPALFTAGMSIVDTTDSVLMVSAYGWAFLKPIRKLYYNMTITLVSVLIAFVVGSLEVLVLIAERFKLEDGYWSGVASLSDSLGNLGYVIIAIFAVSWAMSVAIYHFKRYDEIEVASS